jgi:hypothetical protein
MIFGICQIKSKSALLLHYSNFVELLNMQHFYRDMAKLRKLHLHMLFKWLCTATCQNIRNESKSS